MKIISKKTGAICWLVLWYGTVFCAASSSATQTDGVQHLDEGYLVNGSYGQHNVIPGLGEYDCTYLASVAAGYFLYRDTWDDISAGELTLLAAGGVLAAYQHRVSLAQRGLQASGFSAGRELTEWYNDVFARSHGRSMNLFFSSSEFTGDPLDKFTFEQLIAMTENTNNLLREMAEVTPEGERLCTLITSQGKTHLLCYDKAADRWLFYDSHQNALASEGNPTGSRVYVFEPETAVDQIADYIEPILATEGREIDFTFYSQSPSEPDRDFSASSLSGQYGLFSTALQLFDQGAYTKAAKLFALCKSSPIAAIAATCNDFLKDIVVITGSYMRLARTDGAHDTLALLNATKAPSFESRLSKLRYAGNENDAFLRFLARQFYACFDGSVRIGRGLVRLCPDDATRFFTTDFPALLTQLEETPRDATARKEFLVNSQIKFVERFPKSNPLINWFFQTLVAGLMPSGTRIIPLAGEERGAVLRVATTLLKEDYPKAAITQYLRANGLTEKDLLRAS